MLVAGMFWSVITINLAMIVMIFEVFSKKLSKYFIVLPIIYFGTYTSFTIASHIELNIQKNKVTKNNNEVKAPFNSDTNSLIIDETSKAYIRYPAFNDLSEWLVTNYNIPIVYRAIEYDNVTDRNGRKIKHYLSYKIINTADCELLKSKNDNIYCSNYDGSDGKNVVIRQPDEPLKPPVIIRYTSKEDNNFLLPTTKYTFTIIDKDGLHNNLYGGFASPAKWIPMPIIGCGLGSSKWECTADFLRDDFTNLLDNNNNQGLIANTLGLKYSPAASRIFEK